MLIHLGLRNKRTCYLFVAVASLYTFLLLIQLMQTTVEPSGILNYIDHTAAQPDFSTGNANFIQKNISVLPGSLESSVPATMTRGPSPVTPELFVADYKPTLLNSLSPQSSGVIQNSPIAWKIQDGAHVRQGNDLYSDVFKARVNKRERKIFLQILKDLDKVMSQMGWVYFMYGGTLIGSYRHHNLIPWDDDVDVIMPLSQQRMLRPAFSRIAPGYVLNSDPIHFWKLYPKFSNQILHHSWKWPFVDIFFYDDNETHIWDCHPKFFSTFVFPKTDIFPLKRRPFMGLSLPAPQNTRAVIENNYDIVWCTVGTWVHRWERPGSSISVPCSVLHSYIPFVHRTDTKGGCNETLEFNGKILNYFFDSSFKC